MIEKKKDPCVLTDNTSQRKTKKRLLLEEFLFSINDGNRFLFFFLKLSPPLLLFLFLLFDPFLGQPRHRRPRIVIPIKTPKTPSPAPTTLLVLRWNFRLHHLEHNLTFPVGSSSWNGNLPDSHSNAASTPTCPPWPRRTHRPR